MEGQQWKPNGSGVPRPTVEASDRTKTRPFAVRHYTVGEIASLWSLSDDAVRTLFESEPGVLVIGAERSSRKRRYVTLRIPEDVAERVHRRLSRV
jgi:hypothetical protein